MFTVFPENADIKPPQRVKFGIDPTFPRLHLGHFIPLRLVKKLQDQGHHITLVLGSFTAQMGDPSGRDTTRPILSAEEVSDNAKSILKQVQSILAPGFDVFWNHIIHNELQTPVLLRHLSKFTLSHMLSRNGFEERMNKNNPISMHELIVPILQGLDSVALRSEIEIGGQDQLFNFQIARKLQEDNGQKPQSCLMLPIINGTDGRKMSKSLGNCIFLDESSNDIFGKIMSISDDVMHQWIPLLTDSDIGALPMHPMACKKILAWSIVEQLRGEDEASAAQDFFEQTVQKKETPDNIQEAVVKTIFEAIIAVRNCSKTEARRLLDGGGVKLDGVQIKEPTTPVFPGSVVQVGKRDHLRVK